MTNEDAHADSTLAYWKAVRAAACGGCLNVADNGSCGLKDRPCAVPAQLPLVVASVLRVQGRSMDEYVQAIEEDVCRECHTSAAQGRCGLRDRGECALYTYLPLIVDAIDEVRALPHRG